MPLDGNCEVSVVLPCLNEEGSVGLRVTEERDALAAAGMRGEVIVVDNGSTDASAEVAASSGARIVAESRPGYRSVLLAGFEASLVTQSSWRTPTSHQVLTGLLPTQAVGAQHP